MGYFISIFSTHIDEEYVHWKKSIKLRNREKEKVALRESDNSGQFGNVQGKRQKNNLVWLFGYLYVVITVEIRNDWTHFVKWVNGRTANCKFSFFKDFYLWWIYFERKMIDWYFYFNVLKIMRFCEISLKIMCNLFFKYFLNNILKVYQWI